MNIRARVVGISLAYVETMSGDAASESGSPSTLASSKKICTTARTAQTAAATAARLRSSRPVRETMPSLPDGSRIVAASSQPIVDHGGDVAEQPQDRRAPADDADRDRGGRAAAGA